MKKYLRLGLCGLLLFFGPIHAQENILNIYTWAGFLPEEIIRQFERETHIRVNHSTYVNNEVLYAKLKANPDSGYDIVVPSSYFIARMVKQGLVQKIDRSKLTHFNNVDPVFLNKEHDPSNDFSIPYLWSATGIAVNQSYYPVSSITGWKDLWHEKLKDQLLVLDDTREMFSMALITLGYSVNDTDPDHIKEAFSKLKALMNNIKLFNTEAQRSIYLDEDITIGMGWNGDIYRAGLENLNLHFIYPKEGFIILLDCLAIPKSAKHVENAHRFIDFVLRAEIAKQISLESGFSTPNSAALKLLPVTLQNNEILYPNKKTMERAKFQMDVGEAALRYEKYFELLKLEQ